MGQPPSPEEMLEDLDTHEGVYSRRRREHAALGNRIRSAAEKWGEAIDALYKDLDAAAANPAEITAGLLTANHLRELLEDYAVASAELEKLRAFLHQAGRAVE